MPGSWREILPACGPIFRYYDHQRFIANPSAWQKPKSFFARFSTESGPLIALGRRGCACWLESSDRPSAQFFQFWRTAAAATAAQQTVDFGGGFGGGGGWFGGDLFRAPSSSRAAQAGPRRTFPKAPSAGQARDRAGAQRAGARRCPWPTGLAYGLEDAYAEQPDMGVIRRAQDRLRAHQVFSPRAIRPTGAAAAKGILAHRESRDAIVVMLGPQRPRLDARACGRRNPTLNQPTKRATRRTLAPNPDAKPADAKSGGEAGWRCGRRRQSLRTKPIPNCRPNDAADNGDAPPAIAPEKSTRSPNGVYEFREETLGSNSTPRKSKR